MQTKLPFTLHLCAMKNWGGGEQQLVYLYQALEKQRVPQLIVCRKNSALADHCGQQGLQHITYPRIGSIDFKFAWKLATLCKQYPVDIIHTHDAHSQTAALLAKLLFRIKPVIIVSRKVAFALKKSWISRYKYNSPHVQKIICVSYAVRDVVAKQIKNIEKLVVIHDGIEFSRFLSTNARFDLRHQLGILPHHRLVGTAASLVATKDLFTYIDVAKVLLASGMPLKFLIMGDGPLKAELEAYALQQAVADHIIFMGFQRDIPALLPQLDIFMLTSRQEGMGGVILEAMASQVPVVATRVGGIPEIVIDGETGFLATSGDVEDLAEKMRQILMDAALSQRFVTKANQHISQYTVHRMAEKTLSLYASCAK